MANKDDTTGALYVKKEAAIRELERIVVDVRKTGYVKIVERLEKVIKGLR